MTFETARRAFRAVYVAYIVYASAKTLHFALFAGKLPHHAAHFIIGLAALEILAALAFLFDCFERAACIALLLIYAVAAIFTMMQGEAPAHLILYAATALFITISPRKIAIAD